jgi:hypothetical protein
MTVMAIITCPRCAFHGQAAAVAKVFVRCPQCDCDFDFAALQAAGPAGRITATFEVQVGGRTFQIDVTER